MDRQVLSGNEMPRRWLIVNLDRPRTGPVYSDVFIERWAVVYLDNPVLRLVGVPFSAFLALPNVQAWLNAAAHARFSGRLMRSAEAAIARAERVEGHGENGRLVEKLRHHARKRSRADFLPLTEV